MTNRANCPGLSEITVRDFPKSLSATYRNRCPGLSETRSVEKEINLPAGSILQALPTFTGAGNDGNAMIWTPGQPGGARNVNIRGTGRINCNGYADRGLFLKFAIGCLIDGPRIDAAKLKAIHIGDPGQSTSFEVTVNNVLAYNAETGSNDPSSIGVDFENASDCVGDNIVPIGYRTGIRTAVSTKLIACHPWTTRRYGKMTKAFDLQGAQNKLIACYADNPTSFGDGNSAYAYWLSTLASDAQFFACEGFLPGIVDGIQQGVDNEAYGYYCESNTAYPLIFGGSWASAVSSVKWKQLFGSSNVASTLKAATILGVTRDGRSYSDNLSDNLPRSITANWANGRSSDRGNADVTLGVDSKPIQLFETPLTADHIVTLPSPAINPSRFRIVRGYGATGTYNLIVKTAGGSTLKTIAAAGQASDFSYGDDLQWKLIGSDAV